MHARREDEEEGEVDVEGKKLTERSVSLPHSSSASPARNRKELRQLRKEKELDRRSGFMRHKSEESLSAFVIKEPEKFVKNSKSSDNSGVTSPSSSPKKAPPTHFVPPQVGISFLLQS